MSITNTNYLQPTGFKVTIERTNFPNISYFAQSITHPGATAAAVEVPTRRVTGVPFAGDKITFGEFTISAMLDEDMESYKELYAWMERIVNEGHVSRGNDEGKIPTYADVTITVLTSHNNASNQITYKDAIITDIGSINFTSASGAVEYVTYDASFRFSHFEVT
jgi:hypothetical protein